MNPKFLDAKVDGYILNKTEVVRDCLRQLADQNALEVKTSRSVSNVARHNGLFKLRTETSRGSEFTTVDVLVGASGYNATVSRSPKVREGNPRREVFLASLDFGLQAAVEGDFADPFGDGRIDIILPPDRPGAEYFYVFPFSENFGYVGYVSTFDNRRDCKNQLLESIQKYGIRTYENILSKLKGKFIPGAGTLAEPYADRFLAVGD